MLVLHGSACSVTFTRFAFLVKILAVTWLPGYLLFGCMRWWWWWWWWRQCRWRWWWWWWECWPYLILGSCNWWSCVVEPFGCRLLLPRDDRSLVDDGRWWSMMADDDRWWSNKSSDEESLAIVSTCCRKSANLSSIGSADTFFLASEEILEQLLFFKTNQPSKKSWSIDQTLIEHLSEISLISAFTSLTLSFSWTRSPWPFLTFRCARILFKGVN